MGKRLIEIWEKIGSMDLNSYPTLAKDALREFRGFLTHPDISKNDVLTKKAIEAFENFENRTSVQPIFDVNQMLRVKLKPKKKRKRKWRGYYQ